MNRFLPLTLLVISMTGGPLLFADDIVPPPWDRNDPYAVTFAWEFDDDVDDLPGNPGNQALPDLAMTGNPMSGIITRAEIDDSLTWDNGAWTATGGSSGIVFVVDNVIDHRPVKHVRVQVTHSENPSFLGLDSLGGMDNKVGPDLGFSDITTVDLGVGHTLFLFDIFPNPDWETFTLAIGTDTSVSEVVIDTISIPEPVSAYAAATFAGLLMLRRRRRSSIR